MTDIDTLRETEKRLRATDSNAHASLRTKRREAETAASDDVAAASAALLAGDTVPKPRSVKLHAEIRDIESRVLLAVDAALWGLAAEAREVLRREADRDFRRRLDVALPRWQPPDPRNPNVPAQTQHLARRPQDVVSWVEHGIAKLDAQDADQAERERVRERYEYAKRMVDAAQVEHNAREKARMDQFSEEHPYANQPPPTLFNRAAFLEREGLAEDYGLITKGQAFEPKMGKAEQERVEREVAEKIVEQEAAVAHLDTPPSQTPVIERTPA